MLMCRRASGSRRSRFLQLASRSLRSWRVVCFSWPRGRLLQLASRSSRLRIELGNLQALTSRRRRGRAAKVLLMCRLTNLLGACFSALKRAAFRSSELLSRRARLERLVGTARRSRRLRDWAAGARGVCGASATTAQAATACSPSGVLFSSPPVGSDSALAKECEVSPKRPCRVDAVENGRRQILRVVRVHTTWDLIRRWALWSSQTARQRVLTASFSESVTRRCRRRHLTEWRRAFAAQRLARCLEGVEKRWVGEREWRAQAATDPVLEALLEQFVARLPSSLASHEHSRGPLLAALWARPQAAAAVGRLRGHPGGHPWVLGRWPTGPALELLAESLRREAGRRLEAISWRLEVGRSPEAACALFSELCTEQGPLRAPDCGCQVAPWQQVLVWHALADLVLLYHPALRKPVPRTGCCARQFP